MTKKQKLSTGNGAGFYCPNLLRDVLDYIKKNVKNVYFTPQRYMRLLAISLQL